MVTWALGHGHEKSRKKSTKTGTAEHLRKNLNTTWDIRKTWNCYMAKFGMKGIRPQRSSPWTWLKMSIFHMAFGMFCLQKCRFRRRFRDKNVKTSCQNAHFPSGFSTNLIHKNTYFHSTLWKNCLKNEIYVARGMKLSESQTHPKPHGNQHFAQSVGKIRATTLRKRYIPIQLFQISDYLGLRNCRFHRGFGTKNSKTKRRKVRFDRCFLHIELSKMPIFFDVFKTRQEVRFDRCF